MTELSSQRHLAVTIAHLEFADARRPVRVRTPMQILLIEDETRIVSFLTRGLEAEGYSVHAAKGGPAGLDLALQGVWDLVVLDLLLPGIDGLDILETLHREQPKLPVLILSARSDIATKLRGFELGAVDFLPKPFSLDELLARIRVHIRPQSTVGGDDWKTLAFGRLVLDLSRRQARLDDVVCDLSEREFRLLQNLAEHQGEVTSRERLLTEVWGYSFDPGSNVVEVCIRRLRKKLGPMSPIETVRHAGYRLAP
jgi:two-component system, OmpR family, copper resistance phosphate regulon response regulator CusR